MLKIAKNLANAGVWSRKPGRMIRLMETFKTRLNLDKTEVLLLFGLISLLAGLMFTLGIVVGSGISRPGTETASHHETAEDHASGDHAKVGTAKIPSDSTELKKAFRDSKQKALLEMTLRGAKIGSSVPSSVSDAEAHFESEAGNRIPAKVEDADLSENTEKKIAEERKITKDGNVKNLFERGPSSIHKFVPTPGAYTVQIASFSSGDESSAKVMELRKAGFTESYAHQINLKNSDVWYRVSVGSFPTPVWAKKTGENLVRRKLASDFLIRQVP